MVLSKIRWHTTGGGGGSGGRGLRFDLRLHLDYLCSICTSARSVQTKRPRRLHQTMGFVSHLRKEYTNITTTIQLFDLELSLARKLKANQWECSHIAHARKTQRTERAKEQANQLTGRAYQASRPASSSQPQPASQPACPLNGQRIVAILCIHCAVHTQGAHR